MKRLVTFILINPFIAYCNYFAFCAASFQEGERGLNWPHLRLFRALSHAGTNSLEPGIYVARHKAYRISLCTALCKWHHMTSPGQGKG